MKFIYNRYLLCLCILTITSYAKLQIRKIPYNVRNKYEEVIINKQKYLFYNPHKNKGILHLKGSIHNNTDNSFGIDGYPSGDCYLTASKFRDDGNYDFYTYTDHNFVTKDPKVDWITWIGNSVEDTRLEQHLCIYNLPDDYEYIDYGSNLQEIIDYYTSFGAYVSYAHPDWDAQYQSNEKIYSLNNIHFVEVLNPDSGGSERAFAIMQNINSFVYAVGVDDYHYSSTWSEPNQFFNKACIYAYPQENSKESIWNALLSGCFYASKGAMMNIDCDSSLVAK